MVECVALNLTLVYGLLAYFRTKNTDTHVFLVRSVYGCVAIHSGLHSLLATF